MKIYGYIANTVEDAPSPLEEVTISTNPTTLRELAKFFTFAATAMEKHGEQFGHEHFEDFINDPSPSCRVVVTRERV